MRHAQHVIPGRKAHLERRKRVIQRLQASAAKAFADGFMEASKEYQAEADALALIGAKNVS